ncbi:MAG: hypothetical protein JRI44_10640 [Deltaproteobacteria bacterium]|nr:hypothetical protein [Deltaproteobacteria bacterium]
MRFYPFNIPNLTKDQIEKLAALQSKFIIAVAQINSDLIVKRFEYKEMILQDIADKEKLKAKEKEIINLQLALYENILQFNFELRNILTPEQFKLWRTKSTKIPFPKEKNR